jgi:hypothetical protein
MEIYVLVVVFITSFIQSIFGVGVLLFGTPLLLISGYDFVDALMILLPISLVINLFQITKSSMHINFLFYKKLLIYTIPSIILLLIIAIKINFNFSFFIGIFLLFISLKSLSPSIEKIIIFLFSFDRAYFLLMGIIHGLTNLGGSLLTSKIFSLEMDKDEKRATISLSYFTFALFQILTLIGVGKLIQINLGYLFVGLTVFLLTDFFVYKNIVNKKYDNLFAIFLFLSGCILIFME